jgi:dihydroorotate dehydrogenase (fumarate)
MDLSTEYLGILLNNPIIVGASGLTANMDTIKQIEAAGAGAIIIKSLFEEQIQLERFKQDEHESSLESLDPEIARNTPGTVRHAGADEHLMWTRKAKEELSIPVIASLNCVNRKTWTDYALKLQETGADALELNFHAESQDIRSTAKEIEDELIQIVKEIEKAVSIPISIKLSPFYTNLPELISRLDKFKIGGYVLFNRFFHPDIDMETEAHVTPPSFSNPDANRLPLRYAGLLYGMTPADICAASGIHSGKDVAKMILAGAACIQVVSVLYRNSIEHLTIMKDELISWMSAKGYRNLADFKGKLSRQQISDPWVYKRIQYVQMMMRGNPLDF